MKSQINFDNRIVIVAVGLLIVGLLFYLFSGNNPVVSAQGQASIEANPDLVSVNINIFERENTATQAKDSHDQVSEELLEALEILGIAEEKIELSYYNVYQDYTWEEGTQKENGFVASSNYIVKVSDFDEVPAIVDAAIESGALVSYIGFELSTEKQNEYKTIALEEAAKDAKKKAEATAAGLDKKIGKLVSIQSEDYYYPGPIPYYATESSYVDGAASDEAIAEVKSAALNIAPRKIEVTASVRVNYELKKF